MADRTRKTLGARNAPSTKARAAGAGTKAKLGAAEAGLDRLLDVPLRVEVELGRARLPIADLLRLGPGAMVELNRIAAEPVDVRVNGKLVARGEVVVVNERYAVRITELMSTGDSEGEGGGDGDELDDVG
jgi:flagellar motor switch protein FliN/FliY